MATSSATSSASRPSLQGQSLGFRDSLRALEVGALAIGEQDQVRSIGGRLGGHFESSSIRASQLSEAERLELAADERTQLLVSSKRRSSAAILLEQTLPPKLVVWIVPALLCAAAYAFYNVFIKKGSALINPILGGVILQFVVTLLGTVLIGIMIFKGDAKEDLHHDKNGILWSDCAGIAVGVAEMLSFFVSSMGVPVTQSIPIIIGGSVMFGAVLGLVLLGEKMMLHGWFGVALLVTGIGLVATDPGDKAVEAVGDVFESSPDLVVWIAPALICASAYAFYNIFIKKGSASINPILGGVILQYVAAIFGSLLLAIIVLRDPDQLHFEPMGLVWASCAGLAVGMAEMLSFCVSGMGVQATQSIPIIIGGSVMFGAVLGLLMLTETLMIQGWAGVVLLMTGIAFVVTDPGEKVEGH